jgi:hypothetical protein
MVMKSAKERVRRPCGEIYARARSGAMPTDLLAKQPRAKANRAAAVSARERGSILDFSVLRRSNEVRLVAEWPVRS